MTKGNKGEQAKQSNGADDILELVGMQDKHPWDQTIVHKRMRFQSFLLHGFTN